MRNLVISLPKLTHACIIFGTVSNISRDLRRFLVLATAILPLDDGSTGNGRSWILVAEWWQMAYCQLNPVLWLKQFVTQSDINPHFHEPKLVGRDFERCSVHWLFKFSVGPETSHSHAAHTVCAHGDHGVASLRTAGRLGRGDLGEGRGERVMLWSGAAEEPLDPQQELWALIIVHGLKKTNR